MNTLAPTTVFSTETLTQFLPDAAPLLQKHWDEIAQWRDIPLAPDEEQYRVHDEAGKLRIYTARVDGRLVGYCVFFLGFNIHYKSSLQATQDVLFVDPECRQSRIGLQLIHHAENELRAEGVQAVYQHVKANHLTLAVILERHDYELIDLIYGKRLDPTPAPRWLPRMTLARFIESALAFLGRRH